MRDDRPRPDIMTMSATEIEARVQAALKKRRRSARADADAASMIPPQQPHPVPPNRVFRGG
jgi:hypothetical protein